MHYISNIERDKITKKDSTHGEINFVVIDSKRFSPHEWGELIHFYCCLVASYNIPHSNICETRLYFELNAANRVSGKKCVGQGVWHIYCEKPAKIVEFTL